MNPIPRPEYPRPQFQRDEFVNLNGTWSYAFDFGKSGEERDWQNSAGFDGAITVPFCPESTLSGVGYRDFIPCIWYQRKLEIPARWQDKRILLHFGGVDYRCEIYLDGREIGRNVGGAAPFAVDLSACVTAGTVHNLVVRVEDDPRGGQQPLGKQSPRFASRGCSYTRTTGIWSTVWMEACDRNALESCRIVPAFDSGSFVFTPRYHRADAALSLRISVGGAVRVVPCVSGVPVEVAVPLPHAWSPDDPWLYDVVLEVLAGDVVRDRVRSYAGLRKIEVRGARLFLNNRPIFLRFVLDQGFYPDGIWTAPDDEALVRDIELAMKAGFNGARLHQKIFDERFHYHADRLGYLTWAEFPDWGIAFWQHFRKAPQNYDTALRNYYTEWLRLIERDANHPSIIAWTPFNETSDYADLAEHRRFVRDIAAATRLADPTRPVNDSSGYIHSDATDLWTVHNYAQSAEELRRAVGCEAREELFVNDPDAEKIFFADQPYLVDEYGGVKFIPEGRRPFAANSWGYGEAPTSREAAIERMDTLTQVLLEAPHCAGYCYTQLTDVEQEENGVYCYDRSEKFPPEAMQRIFGQRPAWSEF